MNESNLKMMGLVQMIFFHFHGGGGILRFHVNFLGCIFLDQLFGLVFFGGGALHTPVNQLT